MVLLLLAGHRVFGKFYHNVCFYSKAFMYSVSPSVRSNSFVAPWTVACQAPLTMGFPRQEYEWVAIPFPGDLPNLGIEPSSPALQADYLLSEPLRKP